MAVTSASANDEPGDFAGVDEVFRLLERLARRPRRADRTHLPIVALVGPGSSRSGFLECVRKLLRDEGVTCALVTERPDAHSAVGPDEHEKTIALREMLRRASSQLAGVDTRATGRLRFPRLWLALLLLDLPTPDEPDPRQTERHILREVRRRRRAVRVPDRAVPEGPAWLWATLTTVLFGLPWVLWRLRASGRVGGLYRWFLRQPYLAPRRSSNFAGFARLIAGDAWREESPDQVRLFLVNAFLADLRHAYRRSWRRPFGRRRMAHPVVFVDEVGAGGAAETLLRTVNDVRNGIGASDALVLVSASKSVPVTASEGAEHPPWPAGDVNEEQEGFDSWLSDIVIDRRRRRRYAWFLIVDISTPRGPQRDSPCHALSRMSRPVPPAPFWSRQSTKIAIGVAAVAAAGLIVGWSWHSWSADHCGLLWPASQPDVVTVGGECVGYTDGSFEFIAEPDETFDLVWSTVRDQNQRVQEAAANGRPVATVVYLTDLTPLGSGQAPEDKREELAGLAVLQRQLLDDNAASPLLRILVANAGRGMVQGPFLADRLGELAREDLTVVGVTGLSESRTPTVETVRQLARQGLPVVAATLSADDLAADNPLFHQVAPQNLRQAEVAAAWAADMRSRRELAPNGRPLSSNVRVMVSADLNDLYSQNLASDLNASFSRRGFVVEYKNFAPAVRDGEVSPAPLGTPTTEERGRENIGFDGVVVYAGRGLPDFAGLLAGASQGPVPLILGGDDVTRYIADGAIRRAQQAVPFASLSFAVAPGDGLAGQGEINFYRLLQSMFPFERSDERGRSFDGHAALTYDAAQVYLRAIRTLDRGGVRIPLGPGVVWKQIGEVSNTPGAPTRNNAVLGATGIIDFSTSERRVPLDKSVSIVRVARGEVDRAATITCGNLGAGPSGPGWCPRDTP